MNKKRVKLKPSGFTDLSVRKPRMGDILLSTMVIVVIWQLVVWISGVPSFILPGPLKVALALVNNAALIAEHAWITLLEVLAGLVLGTLLGIVTALYIMMSRVAQRLLMPVLVLSQTIPVFALAPVLTLWLGYGLSSKIVMTLLIIYFPVTSTFLDGLHATPRGFLDLARTMRASRLTTLIQVRVPAALPSLASGIRLAAVYAPIGAVIGEWVGASQGLGYLMLLANGRVKIDLMFAALITLCLLTILLRAAIGVICEKINDWAGQTSW
jgi:putative hydroxymethylpyrimidine transport system permease protein